MNEQELAELDLAVAKAEGFKGPHGTHEPVIAEHLGCLIDSDTDPWEKYQPTRDPAEAMRLLEKYKGNVGHHVLGYWACSLPAPWVEGCGDVEGTGANPMEAICRAVVALKSAP